MRALRRLGSLVVGAREEVLELIDLLRHVRERELRVDGSRLGRVGRRRESLVLNLELVRGECDFHVDVALQLLVRTLDGCELGLGVRELGLDRDDGGVRGGARVLERGVEFGFAFLSLLPRLGEDGVGARDFLLELRGPRLGLRQG